MNIGWPEGIYLALALLSLLVAAAKHGEPREPYSFPVALVSFIIAMLLIWLGGFFA